MGGAPDMERPSLMGETVWIGDGTVATGDDPTPEEWEQVAEWKRRMDEHERLERIGVRVGPKPKHPFNWAGRHARVKLRGGEPRWRHAIGEVLRVR
jgi:sugar phosphate isomerase/epimerase